MSSGDRRLELLGAEEPVHAVGFRACRVFFRLRSWRQARLP